jgi:hypothetical protein
MADLKRRFTHVVVRRNSIGLLETLEREGLLVFWASLGNAVFRFQFLARKVVNCGRNAAIQFCDFCPVSLFRL